MKYAFIKDNNNFFSIDALCDVLEVSRSGYYDWLYRPVSNREQSNNQLLGQIIDIHASVEIFMVTAKFIISY